MTNARFKTYANGSDATITLRPGQTLSHSEGGPDEEGYSYSATLYRYDGETVVREITTTACDCDGRLDRYYDQIWPVNGPLNSYGYPDWEDLRAYQRDHFAEAMNY